MLVCACRYAEIESQHVLAAMQSLKIGFSHMMPISCNHGLSSKKHCWTTVYYCEGGTHWTDLQDDQGNYAHQCGDPRDLWKDAILNNFRAAAPKGEGEKKKVRLITLPGVKPVAATDWNDVPRNDQLVLGIRQCRKLRNCMRTYAVVDWQTWCDRCANRMDSVSDRDAEPNPLREIMGRNRRINRWS